MELLTTALANMPEPRRGEIVKGLSTTIAADVARKREWLEQKLPGRPPFDTPKGLSVELVVFTQSRQQWR